VRETAVFGGPLLFIGDFCLQDRLGKKRTGAKKQSAERLAAVTLENYTNTNSTISGAPRVSEFSIPTET